MRKPRLQVSQDNLIYKWMGVMDIVNLKILGIYYSVQKLLSDNLASPMALDIKPIIGMDKDDFGALTEKVISHLRKSPKPEKMNAFIKSLFRKIDIGEIKPERYLGHNFSADDTIKQMQMHDSFMTLYDAFFNQFSQSTKVVGSIRNDTLSNIKQLNIEKDEYWMFKKMMINQEQRSPITLELEVLRDVVDVMYEAACTYHGPALADKFLSQAVKESSRLFPAYRADNFL